MFSKPTWPDPDQREDDTERWLWVMAYEQRQLELQQEADVDIRKVYPSKYLGKDDVPVGQEFPLVISSVSMEDVGESDTKPVLRFEKAKKGMVLNKSNSQVMGVLYGWETDNWIGKAVMVWHDPSVQFMGKVVGGLRIKAAMGAAPAKPEPMPVNTFTEDADPDDPIPF